MEVKRVEEKYLLASTSIQVKDMVMEHNIRLESMCTGH